MKLGAPILAFTIGSLNEEFFEDKLQIFWHDVVARLLHEFIDFFAFSVASSSDTGIMQIKVGTLAVLDAFVVATIICLRANESEIVATIARN